MIKIVQLALFVASLDLSNKLDFANKINKVVDGQFDGEPVLLPVPDSAPQEIPRIMLRSKDEKDQLQISLSRIDFILNLKSETTEKPSLIYANAYKKIQKITNLLISDFSLSIDRIGLITSFTTHDKQSLEKVYKFIKEKSINREGNKGIQLHLYFQEKLDKFLVNKWVRVIANQAQKTEDNYFVNVDYNTVDSAKYDLNDLESFYKNVVKSTLADIDAYQ